MSSVNQQTIEQTKQQIKGLIAEIAQLSKSDLTPEEYYAAFLQRVVSALAAVGGAIWMLSDERKPTIAYQINLNPTLMDETTDDALKHNRLLDAILRSNSPQLIPPLSGAADEKMGANPTRNLLVINPLGHDGQAEGLVEIFQRPDTAPATQRGYQRFLAQMCELASEWFKNRKLRHFGERHSLWAQADAFSRTVHETLDLRETCYNVVNEGRRLLGVDRVTICIQKGSKCKVEAISGQDTLDNRSNVVTNLSLLATRVVASGEPLWYHGSTEDMPPQIEKALEAYVDESFTRSMTILPLRRPRGDNAAPSAAGESTAQKHGEIIGALIVEQIESEIPREVLNPRLELVYEHSGRAISNSLDHTNLFLMPVWRTLGKAAWVVRARTLPKTIAITALVLITLVLMIAIPWDFDMKAKGELKPIVSRDVFALVPGQIVELFVDNGSTVKAGDVLCVLKNEDLNNQLTEVRGKYDTTKSQLDAARTTKIDPSAKMSDLEKSELEGRILQLRTQVESLELQVAAVEEKVEHLKVKAPIDGKVITWDVRKQLENRPLEVGQVLMTIAKEDQGFELELYMRQTRIGHVNDWRQEVKSKDPNADLNVQYILLSDPSRTHTGKVIDIDETSQSHEQEGHVVRVRVRPDSQDELKGVRSGTTVKADVNCGKAPVGWVLFHEAWEFLESNVFFW